MEIYLARTQGFCAGVASAVEIVDKALENMVLPSMFIMRLCIIRMLLRILNNGGLFLLKLSMMFLRARVLFLARMVFRRRLLSGPNSGICNLLTRPVPW